MHVWACGTWGWRAGWVVGQTRQATRLTLPVSGGWPACVMEGLWGFIGAWWAGIHARVRSGWWGGSTELPG
eukprot:13424850-Alexandrium_andersonii.AAC.1